MSETKQPRGDRAEARAERLKAALRDNLKRRKAQARERAGADRDGPDETA